MLEQVYGMNIGQPFNEYVGTPLSANILISIIQVFGVIQFVAILGIAWMGSSRLGYTYLLLAVPVECLVVGTSREVSAGQTSGYPSMTDKHMELAEKGPMFVLGLAVVFLLGASMAPKSNKVGLARRSSFLSAAVLKLFGICIAIVSVAMFVYPRYTLSVACQLVFGEKFVVQTPLGTEMMLGMWLRLAGYSFVLSQIVSSIKPSSVGLALIIISQGLLAFLGLDMVEKYAPIKAQKEVYAAVPAGITVLAFIAWLTVPGKSATKAVSKGKKKN